MDALHAMPRFVNFGLQTPEIHAPLYCSKKVIGSDMFYFYSQDGSTVGTVALLASTYEFGKRDCFYRASA